MATGKAFRARLLIDCNRLAKPFMETIADWQQADFEALDEGWEMVAGLRTSAKYLRAYLERGRGHSKTTDIAVMAAFALWASTSMLWGIAAANDRHQARFIRNAIHKLVALNPWLNELLEIQNFQVLNRKTGSTLEIISHDADSSYGATPDFVIVDELTHWKKRDLWDSLFSSAAKRASCMLVIIANAGFGQGQSWQWELREKCRESPKWHFSRLDGPRASWVTQEHLDEQRAIMPIKAYQRLWLNQWVRESGEGLEWEDIEAAMTLDGPSDYDPKYVYLAGLDLGLRNDHAALAVLGVDPVQQRFRVAKVQWWAPGDSNGQIDLSEVRQACLDAHAEYRLSGFVYDAYQAVLMMEDLSRQAALRVRDGSYRPMKLIEFKFNGEGLSWMAETLLQVFRNRQIDLYNERSLLDDLMRVQIEERAIGYKLTARRDEKGHADRAIALAMILPFAVEGAKVLAYQPTGSDGLGDSLI